MGEFQEFEENSMVVKYNNELWFYFIQLSEKILEKIEEQKKKDVLQSLDLLRAINSYRSYRTHDELFNVYPDLAEQKEYVELLWEHFGTMNDQELSDLAIQMIHEVV